MARALAAAALLGAALSAWCAVEWPAPAWSAVQLARSLWPSFLLALPEAPLGAAEAHAFALWEAPLRAARPRPPLQIPSARMEDVLARRVRVDLAQPLLLRGFVNATQPNHPWDVAWLAAPPRGDLSVPFFRDARRFNTVPDGEAPLRDIIANITRGGYEKFGTEALFRRYPELLRELDLPVLHSLFGDGHFDPRWVGSFLTVPVFMARGHAGLTTRTDLHCEPIANAVLQLAGSKRWTLLHPSQSHLLRPQVAPDGRAYFYSSLSPSAAAERLALLERFEVVAEAGDLLYLPTWTWHRVDYLDGVVALSVSLFHFRPLDFVARHAKLAALAAPNLAKELVGWKTQ